MAAAQSTEMFHIYLYSLSRPKECLRPRGTFVINTHLHCSNYRPDDLTRRYVRYYDIPCRVQRFSGICSNVKYCSGSLSEREIKERGGPRVHADERRLREATSTGGGSGGGGAGERSRRGGVGRTCLVGLVSGF